WILAGVKSHEGDVVPVGTTIAWLVAPGEKPPVESAAAAPAARTMTSTPAAAPAAPRETTKAAAPGTPQTPQISQKARRLAQEKGVDITSIRGTGPDGTITSDDVMKAAEAPKAPAAAASASSNLSAIARLMAERTTQSWTQVPHFFLLRDVDAGALLELREKLGRTNVTHTDMLVALVGKILAKHPKVNASWDNGNIRMNPSINISVAMAVPDGVAGAVIPNADKTSVRDIATQRRELTERARGNRLKPADVTGGTFTITNLGMYNIDAFNAIIAPPQAA